MPGIKLVNSTPWSPHPQAAPITGRRGGRYYVASNGTRSCSGGWQFEFTSLVPGTFYEIIVEGRFSDLKQPRDSIFCVLNWSRISPDTARPDAQSGWDYLLPEFNGSKVTFSRLVQTPAEGGPLTVRCNFRWADKGKVSWSEPSVTRSSRKLASKKVMKIAVVTGGNDSRPRPVKTIQDNIDFYLPLCEKACEEKPDLLLLPEVALQWEIAAHPFDVAVPAPGPETDVFARIARKHKTRICLGLFERDEDAVFNSALLIGPNGQIDGRYHKVHLAVGGEAESGILPGNGFPVFDTEIGRVGCNICMDSSAAESSRMVGLNGAEFLLLPIMGDHRASRWTAGSPNFSEDRWKAIMRTRAMDNQLTMVVARNSCTGSCIIDRKGEILAWNEGEDDFIFADVPIDDGYRTWNGGCFKSVNWLQRRPHLYGEYSDIENTGSLR
ncbi:MAG: carbon-nitrogen hydrolase family protein [Planctomycetota bacterium]|nr:carbon-nitrogen hydrolase family protein [Planctomycetota bacterium]MDA1141423.1 carbon-nitrogen hydrolase family protein [Planctomycetota bacterium]